MGKTRSSVILVAALAFQGCTQSQSTDKMKLKKLTREEERVIIYKGTERPFSGIYYDFWEKGSYICKRCGARLYESTDKFDAGCGWPSFDDEVTGAVRRQPDADGDRTEILCTNCDAHLGHIFEGEGFTKKNSRHCVNSLSLVFVPDKSKSSTDTAIFAGGCFWGVEYYMQQTAGVLSVVSGFTGGHNENPDYEQVCSGKTGHYEAVEVVFDPSVIGYEELAKRFFEIHDPTQWNRQGPDIGEQYRSAVFYKNDMQKSIVEKLISILKNKGFRIVTEVLPAGTFWKAGDDHQDYYERNGSTPYCHSYVKRF